MTQPSLQSAAQAASRPWWHHGHVWLVIAGPALVVVAAVATAVIAIHGADTVVGSDVPQPTVHVERQAARDRALLPAAQARNHAATPTVDR